MQRTIIALAATLALIAAPAAHGQDKQVIEKAVSAVAQEWARTWNARDAAGWAALHDTPAGLFIVGGSAWPFDSLAARASAVMASRSNESWTIDRTHVIVLDESEALMQLTASGRFTLADGQTWVCDSSGFETALLRKRGTAWKIVAFQNSASCRRGS